MTEPAGRYISVNGKVLSTLLDAGNLTINVVKIKDKRLNWTVCEALSMTLTTKNGRLQGATDFCFAFPQTESTTGRQTLALTPRHSP